MQDIIEQYFSTFQSQSQSAALAEIQKHRLNGRIFIALELIKAYGQSNKLSDDLASLEKMLVKDTNIPQSLIEHWEKNKNNRKLYPQGILGIREGVQSLASLQGSVRKKLELFLKTPVDFACELSLIVRDDFNSYLAIKELIRNRQKNSLQPSGDDITAVEIVCEIYDESSDSGSSRFLKLLSTSQPWQVARILRTQKLKKTTSYIKNIAHKVITKGISPAILTDLQKVNLLVISYPALSHDDYKKLCISIEPTAPTDGIHSAEKWRKTWIRAAFSGMSGPLSKSAITPPPKLRIALCVSGQLRGFKDAFATWSNFGLHDHDIDTYVHTWKNVGVRFPDPKWRPHVERRFQDQNFITKYIKLCDNHGIDEIKRLYPSIFSTETGDHIANHTTLQKIYGETSKILIDDESDPKFARMANQDKMYYKIMECFKLAQKSGKEYDLIIRIRPDFKVGPHTKINWHDIYKACQTHKVVFSETAPLLKENIFIGDQLGIATYEVAKTYSECYKFHDQAREENILGIPATRLGHTSLAWTLLLHGIKSQELPHAQWGGLSDVQKLDNKQIRILLEKDIGENSENFIHQELLSSLAI